MNAARLAASLEVQSLALTLLHFIWQGVLIAAALGLALSVLPRTRSTMRYAACCAALTAMLGAPLVTLGYLLQTAPIPSLQVIRIGAAGVAPGSSYMFLGLSVAWALGCGIMTARLVLGFTRLGGWVRRAEGVDGHWQARLATLAHRLGVHQRVRLFTSSEVDAPLMLGWLRPVILVPIGALTMLPAAYVEALLLHELGHARRLDYLANLIQACVEAALFYHPAVHWVSARLRDEREHCCDDLAVDISGDRLGYARALAAMEGMRAPIGESALAANGGSLLARVERIVHGNAALEKRRSARSALTAACLLGAATCLSLVGVWSCSTDPGFDRAESSLAIRWLPPAFERWKPALAEAAQRHRVNPALLAIVTLVESLGNPAARSSAGAIGLMQLMPATAAQIAAERDLADYSEARLWEPGYNLDFGAWYLAEQLAEFGAEGDRAVAIAAVAYNGGPQQARAYLERAAPLYAETQAYRDLVLGMWQEREDAVSPTFTAWREKVRRRRAQ